MRTSLQMEVYPNQTGAYYDVIMLMSLDDYRALENMIDLSNNTINQCKNNSEYCFEAIKK